MQTRRYTCFLIALAACCVPISSAQDLSSPKGHLVIVGGNGLPDAVAMRAVALSGGAAAKVVVFPQASQLEETGQEAVAFWKKAGAGQAVEVNVADRAATIAAVSAATFIWFPGGDQVRLADALRGTGLPELIRRRYVDGATVGGTSAGAAVMSSAMITGDADLQSITVGRTEIAEGFGLLPGAIIDQHFQKRQRMNRLISAVLDQPRLIGIGIDEKTAIIVTGGRSFEVLGDSSVVVIDARRARVSSAAQGDLGSGTDLKLHVLVSGMTFDLRSR
jgi:cyanophycinase